MSKPTGIALILVVIIAQLWLLTLPRSSLHGDFIDESYRRKERLAALFANRQHHSAETQAAYVSEVGLLHAHMRHRQWCLLTSVIVVNAVGIYMFLQYGIRKETAN